VKSAEGAQIDLLIALVMAAGGTTQPLPAIRFDGFLLAQQSFEAALVRGLLQLRQ
jgi:hypothetical protein